MDMAVEIVGLVPVVMIVLATVKGSPDKGAFQMSTTAAPATSAINVILVKVPATGKRMALDKRGASMGQLSPSNETLTVRLREAAAVACARTDAAEPAGSKSPTLAVEAEPR